MARRITFNKLINSIRLEVPRVKELEFASELVADIITKIWNFQDFRETLGQLPPFFLVGDVQDYGPPVFTVPADFQALRGVSLKNINYGADGITVQTYPLIPKTRQQPLVTHGWRPEVLSYEPQGNFFRVHPVLPTGVPSNAWMVEGVYKKLPQTNLYDTTNFIGIPILTTDITPENYNRCLLPLDDRHYTLFKDIAVVLGKKLAGGLSQDSVAAENYIDMKIRKIAIDEGIDIGSSNLTPMEPLMSDPSSTYGPFVFF